MENMSTAQALNPVRYRELLAEVMPVAIETEAENDRILAKIERLMMRDELSPEEENILRLMVTLVEDFETRCYQPGNVTPLDALHELMSAREAKPSDLWELFGSKGVASEVLNGKRGISKAQAKALAEYFKVSVEIFI